MKVFNIDNIEINTGTLFVNGKEMKFDLVKEQGYRISTKRGRVLSSGIKKTFSCASECYIFASNYGKAIRLTEAQVNQLTNA